MNPLSSDWFSGESDFWRVLPARRCWERGRKDSDFYDGSDEAPPATGLTGGIHNRDLHPVLQSAEPSDSGDAAAARRMPEQFGALEETGRGKRISCGRLILFWFLSVSSVWFIFLIPVSCSTHADGKSVIVECVWNVWVWIDSERT